MCSWSLISACRKPREWRRPASASSRACSSPSTLKNTRALRRSGLVSTPVTVTKPMRGSFRPAASCAERTSLTASFTLRIRAPAILDHPPAFKVNVLSQHVLGGDQAALDPHALRKLRGRVALELGCRVIDHRGSTPNQGRRERAALPQVVMVGLRDGGSETLLQVSLQRLHLLALALEAVVFRQVQVDLDKADEAYSSSLSTWRVSNTSSTSPSFTSW